MSHPFVHPAAESLLQRVAHLFSSRKAFLRKDRHIVFVCGGPIQHGPPQGTATPSPHPPQSSQSIGQTSRAASLRSQFLDYADKQLINFRFFLAERASIDLLAHSEPQFLDLAAFELLISEIADCIVLFPESAGSIAELGFFSNSKDVRKKILLVNDQQYQGSESFINLGPVNLINTWSNFRPSIVLDFQSRTIDFSPVREKLTRLIRSSNRKAFVYKPVRQMNSFEKVSVVLELINIFQIVTLEHLLRILESAFEANEADHGPDEVPTIISFLIALQLIERKGDGEQYFVMGKNVESFIDFDNITIDDIKAEILLYYREHEPETLGSLSRLIT